jgi:glycosyltransferase involved in cell wall biosynthesis
VTTIHHPITSDLRIALAATDSWKLRLLIKRWHSFLRMQKKVTRQLSHIVTVSKASRDDIARDFEVPADAINIVANGIDTEVFKPLDSIEREPCTVMVTASADVPLKGLDYLLKAIAEIRDDYPQLKLIVLGKLKQDGETARLIERLGIRDLMTFYSGLSSDEVAALYARATCAVIPSIYEGFGLPAGEAMACSVPVISTTGGALPEVVGDAGLMVPPADHQSIAAAIRRYLDDPDLRETNGRKGFDRIQQYFSWEVAASEMAELYHDIIVEAH